MTTNKNDWYWINGSAYCPECVEGNTPAIDAADATRGPCESGRCACCGQDDGELLDVLEDAGYFKQANEYCIAFVHADGSWDRFKTFTAENDDAANAYAEEHFDGKDWYVLDVHGRNINGGDQE